MDESEELLKKLYSLYQIKINETTALLHLLQEEAEKIRIAAGIPLEQGKKI